ncbi:glycosyltransferase family 4 protein [Bifidobacterium vespertilionis]|uniref:glycosyltransferase family 4 protein n=1 Tax=Bifidobacterium vespertilionis TaxID=2562524 RepID=UPI001BDD7DBD|nr:glycosyltransferase family 4 protein [Bifidobacterium vespertilionis]MBT1179934.1 glycosyltransferase family 4 protein [Bifidobacterium vespertilionis]
MKTMLMIPPQYLPVPAVRGGAVEQLCTQLIEGNERDPRFDIEVLSCLDEQLGNPPYLHTRVVQVSPSFMDRIRSRIHNKIAYLTETKKYLTPSDLWIMRKVRRSHCDVLLVENDMLACDRLAKYKQHSRLVYHMHNGYDGSSKTPELVRDIMPHVDAFIVISDYLKRIVTGAAASDKVHVLPNAIDIGRFRVGRDRENQRKRLGIAADEVVFVYSGRINKEKGVLELIEAYTGLADSTDVRTKLLIVGKSWFGNTMNADPYVDELKAMCSGRDDIIFTGFVQPEDMPKVLSAADVAVIPSRWEEPFGLVVLEAMAADLTVIATRSGAIPEIVSEESALLVDNHDETIVHDLCEAMRRSLDGDVRQTKTDVARRILDESPDYDVFHYFDNFCREAFR